MARTTHFRYVLLILCLGAATLPAQEADLLPPLPPPYAVPPPEPETLPPPPQLEWSPLGPKDEGGGGSIVETAMVPPPEAEAPIAPPPPPVIETPLPGEPDLELAKPDVEVWRPESESPQTPARLPERLDTAYVAGPAPVWLRVQYNPLAAGKRVLVRTGRGITVNVPGGVLTIPPSGECLVQAQLGAGINRSHVNFYCDGIKTALPVVLASLQTVEGAENGGGQEQGTASTGTASPDEDPEGDTGALREQVETGGSYSAHSGNASRIVKDLHVPGALGTYGLDFTRYWNSLNNADINIAAEWPTDFGYSGWSHSWRWKAVYDWELPDMEHFPPPYTYETSIMITFPDGHATKFKLTRGDLNAPPLSRDHRVGPPYYLANYERDWAAPGPGVHDNLAEMAQDGSQFWLYRSDGGSVHFVGTNGPNPGGYYHWKYKVTEIYDPHGLKTQLGYEGDEADPRLNSVVQEDGRWLRINWSNYGGQMVIGSVQTGFAGSQQVVQQVVYEYTGSEGSLVLRHAVYDNTPAMGQTASATYDYVPNVLSGPLLQRADDPHFAGAMTKISYSYYGHICPEVHLLHPPPEIHDWYYFLPEAIGAEMSGDTGEIVASFGPVCREGRRWDYNGLGGERILYYGGSAQDGQITGPIGHSLNKATDFYKRHDPPSPPPSGVPSRKQNRVEPTKVWDGCNIETDLTYDNSGRAASIHHPEDGSTYFYDRVNPGTSDDPDLNRIHNRQHHWLFRKEDELHKVTKYIRDARRRVKRIEYPDNSSETFEYDNNNPNGLNQVTSHTLPSGAIETYVYDPSTHLLKSESNSVDGLIKEYTHDALGRVETMRDARAIADVAPYTERMEYNGWHQITKIHYRATGGSGDPTVTYEYDNYGNRTAVIDELGHRKDYTYDAYRRCLSLTEQAGSSAGCNSVPERRWDWIYDRVIQYEDGTTTTPPLVASRHTSKEWRIQIEPEFNGERHRRATARVFDVNNRMISEETGLIQLPTEDLGRNLQVVSDTGLHSFEYDGNGQKITSTDPRLRVTRYTYDRRNRLQITKEPKRLDQEVYPETRFEYDVAGNKTKITFPDPEHNTQEWGDYDAFGQAWTFTNEKHKITNLTYKWGPMKKLDTVKTYRDMDEGAGQETQLTSFQYDGMGRLRWTHFPDTTTEVSDYVLGQLSAFKTRRNQTKRLHYDARGRESYHTWDSNAAPGITRVWDDASRLTSIANIFSTIDYGYDDAGQVKWEGNSIAGTGRTEIKYCRYPSGEVSQMTYPNGTVINRFYTPRGQLKGVGWGVGSTSYAYNPDGTVDYQAWDHVLTTYGYDGRGMISSIRHTNTVSGRDLAKRDYWRDDRDRIVAWKRGSDTFHNGMEDGRGDRYHYDPEGQLDIASYRVANPEGSPGVAQRTDIFHYDELGNRVRGNYIASRGWMDLKRRNNGLNQYESWENDHPSPDPLHWGSGIFHDDNIPPNPTPTPPATPAPPHPYVFPGNGVVMQDGYVTAGFNALNQPICIWSFAYQNTPNWMFFGFDPLGRCVKRWVGPQGVAPAYPTYYYYDGWNLVQEGVSGATAIAYVHGGRVDEIVASGTAGTGRQHHYDARGHCILLTTSAGAILEQYDYDAFGRPYFYGPGGSSMSYSWYGNRFLFTGREWIKELRLYDYRARLYQPELGRFLQPDPKEFAAGDYNLYRYCHNDPVNKSDPTGLQDERLSDIMKKRTVEFGQYKPVLGSWIPQWTTLFTVIFNPSIGGNYSKPTPQNNSKAGLTAYGKPAHGKTDPATSVKDLGSRRLEANLSINVWINPAAAAKFGFDHIAGLEKEHVYGGEGYKMKGLIGPGGFWDQEKAKIGGSISVWRWQDGAKALAGQLSHDLDVFKFQQHSEMDAGGGSHDLPPF